jgi:hypothetical protein
MRAQQQASFFSSTMAQATRDAEGFVQSISNIPENEDFVVYGTIHAFPESADALEAVYVETTWHRVLLHLQGMASAAAAPPTNKTNISIGSR